ncbi:ABC transporter substrate-binding protein [Natrarchaeobaculum sulfurireducens]|uniref:ABC-type transport system, periplasmic component n=2 Tax=Natrarchaeobaculum sulfurireducens TaxID=2044521 RepID=A0A346PTV2_9EURY|nr:ABC transporter substrate-binding protein [Natrarchaeobaculum sulfurireducens]AXR77086.1 ABC-type transport system, periplasmic component [Natrarchaeobaculum sulfurireducens]AXR82947.1 Oligopeptide ABC transporter, periplasmic oligopeptide-binding protein OppA [Natrarchaeobaculum sulfurireducens]
MKATEDERPIDQRLRRRRFLGAIAAGCTAGVAGCAEGASDDIDGETVTIVPPSNPADSDDQWERWSGMTPYWTRVVEPLVWGTKEMHAKPWLATDWELTDDTTWVFELREGVTFHNGAEMTADDVVHSYENDILERYGDFVYGWLHLEPGSVEKIDDYTVEFTNTEPFPDFPGTIGHNMLDVHPPSADPWNGDVIGTGPFTLEDVEDGQYVELGTHDDYWGGDVAPDGLTVRAAEDETTRTNLLESGDADVVLEPSKPRLTSLRRSDEFVVETQQSSGSTFVSFNLYEEPTDDADLRRALNYAVSQSEIVEEALGGLGRPASGPISTVIDWAADDELPDYERDHETARELVADSSYDGEELTCLVRGDQDDDDLIAQILQSEFDAVGVDLDIELLERAAYQDRTGRGEFHLAIDGTQSNSPGADYIMWENFHSRGVDNIDLYEADGTGLHNLGGEVDDLIETGFQSNDPEQRHEAYVEAQRRIVEEAVVIPITYREYAVAMDATIEGVELHPIDRLLEWRSLRRSQ